ncbi:HAMP domain-containing sensor histidine kinase [Sporomusa sp.]|uniref:sensor histidine kinase n=1 Tax=Sporomusa sp. TaxID=2078658 RepID=UPI002CF214A1|nr:HAMP domain-containing sensor histidine kinase [Sporomusa sp.]HWR07466.1 HAMP domain-containing sensor histidine kinase [Sporomusa sp.]
MFAKILRKLTLLNSVVVILIFLVFGATLYSYVSSQLFDNIDNAMKDRISSFKVVNGRPDINRRRSIFFDPRVIMLLRDANGQVAILTPISAEDGENLKALATQLESGNLTVKTYADHIYRVLCLPYQYDENVLFRSDGSRLEIQEVIAVSIVDSEVAMLRQLLIIIASGLFAGILVIGLAGYYLARMALVPIQTAWERQQQFVADASHELRTPLTVVKTNAELMLRHPENTVEQESTRVTNILREAIRMNKLVSTLLTLARADANQLELQLKAVVINEVLETVVEQFRPLVELKGLELNVSIEPQIEITADRERLHQLLVILFDNALKYTSPPGKITITCSKLQNQVVLTVEDTGCGILSEDMPRVFDRFFRGDKARHRETGGAGLGLSIAQWIVEKHGGRIRVESAPNVGTQFYITLPLKNKV